jgi:hypothetical protein
MARRRTAPALRGKEKVSCIFCKAEGKPTHLQAEIDTSTPAPWSGTCMVKGLAFGFNRPGIQLQFCPWTDLEKSVPSLSFSVPI